MKNHSLTERQELEDELLEWLEERKIKNAGEFAENFAESAITIQDLERLETNLPPKELATALSWISKTVMAEKIVDDIREASQRISDLVGAIKNFTHMDRGDSRTVFDIHSGINNTLTILNHKIRKNNIKLIRDFEPSLPLVSGFAGELNQVWTNLIDNALDAMETTNSGVLKITTNKDKQYVRVAISDTGSGIPPDIQTRIFEPFFTTKEMGKGTGLGLDVVSRIVNQHKGTIKVKSVPGNTEFVVCFPIDS